MQVSSQSTAALGAFCRPMKVAYPVRPVNKSLELCLGYLREHWNKIAMALIAGLLAGFFAGAVNSREFLAMGDVVYAAGLVPTPSGSAAWAVKRASEAARPSAAEQAAIEEASRLRAENQQLQALVNELQNEHAPAHARKGHARHRRRSGSHA